MGTKVDLFYIEDSELFTEDFDDAVAHKDFDGQTNGVFKMDRYVKIRPTFVCIAHTKDGELIYEEFDRVEDARSWCDAQERILREAMELEEAVMENGDG